MRQGCGSSYTIIASFRSPSKNTILALPWWPYFNPLLLNSVKAWGDVTIASPAVAIEHVWDNPHTECRSGPRATHCPGPVWPGFRPGCGDSHLWAVDTVCGLTGALLVFNPESSEISPAPYGPLEIILYLSLLPPDRHTPSGFSKHHPPTWSDDPPPSQSSSVHIHSPRYPDSRYWVIYLFFLTEPVIHHLFMWQMLSIMLFISCGQEWEIFRNIRQPCICRYIEH